MTNTLNRIIGSTVTALSVTTMLLAAYPGVIDWTVVPAYIQWTLLGSLCLTTTIGIVVAVERN